MPCFKEQTDLTNLNADICVSWEVVVQLNRPLLPIRLGVFKISVSLLAFKSRLLPPCHGFVLEYYLLTRAPLQIHIYNL